MNQASGLYDDSIVLLFQLGTNVPKRRLFTDRMRKERRRVGYDLLFNDFAGAIIQSDIQMIKSGHWKGGMKHLVKGCKAVDIEDSILYPMH